MLRMMSTVGCPVSAKSISLALMLMVAGPALADSANSYARGGSGALGGSGGTGTAYGADAMSRAYNACGQAHEGERCQILLLNHIQPFKVDGTIRTILVGNPAIADVTPMTTDTFALTAKSVGATNVLVMGNGGEMLASYEVFVREPDSRRVTLRLATAREHYQCSPNCNRALAMDDTPENHNAASTVVQTQFGVNAAGQGGPATPILPAR